MKHILALDPGNTETGYVWLQDGKIVLADIVKNREMLRGIDQFCRACGESDERPRVAIEMIGAYGMPVGHEVFDTCRWIGRFEERCEDGWHIMAELYMRCQVKLAACGSPRAKDANVRQAMLDRFGPQGTKRAMGPTYGLRSHCWAALAVGAYAIDNQPGPRT